MLCDFLDSVLKGSAASTLFVGTLVWLERGEAWDLQLPCCEESKPRGGSSGLRWAVIAFRSFQVIHKTRWVNEPSDDSDGASPVHWITPRDTPRHGSSASILHTWWSRDKPSSVCPLWIPGSENVSTIKWLLFCVSKFGVVCYIQYTIIIRTVIKPERYIVSLRNRLLLKLIKVGTTCGIVYRIFLSFQMKIA